MVYTFKNHPRKFINKEGAPKLLVTLHEKIRILEDLNVDLSSFVEFNKKFMELEPEEFIENLIKTIMYEELLLDLTIDLAIKIKVMLSYLRNYVI